jgi:hypothetical protein
MTSASTSVAAAAATGLLLATFAHAAIRGGTGPPPPSPREVAYAREAEEAASERCALYHARFGGRRAQLIAVVQNSVRNYVVMEVGKRDPAMRSLRSNWLHANYGEAEHVWIGEYASADSALARAASLCPPALRCWPGESGCGPQSKSPSAAQLFFESLPLAVTPEM